MSQPIKQAQTTVDILLGPIKIKDGLFLGDHFAAKDIEFIISNKVTHIINTVVKTVPNLYQKFGIQYLSVHWTEQEENIFDRKGNALEAIFTFIEETVESGQSCLIHSNSGKSRGFAVLAAYLMRKYSWSLEKCLEYTRSKKEGLQIRENFMQQLRELEGRMKASSRLSLSWNEYCDEEDQLLANTMLNSRKAATVGGHSKKSSKKRVGWNEKLVNRVQMPHTTTFKHKQRVKLRSILKGEVASESEVEEESQFEGKIKPQNRITNNVQTAVNNFMETEKKDVEGVLKLNTRPYSSDAKVRPAYKDGVNSSKTHAFASTLSSSSPYEARMGSRVGSAKGRKVEARVGGKPSPVVSRNNPTQHPYQRPISAKLAERRPAKPAVHHSNPLAEKLLPDTFMQGGVKMRRIGGGRLGRGDGLQ